MPEQGLPGAASGVPSWVVVRTAPDQLTAEIWRGLLEANGIPATLAPADAVSFMGVSAIPCRLLVPNTWVEAAEQQLEGLPVEED